jgi:hypothetical protein
LTEQIVFSNQVKCNQLNVVALKKNIFQRKPKINQ